MRTTEHALSILALTEARQSGQQPKESEVRLKYADEMYAGGESLSRVAERIPGWVERLLIPTLESKVRAIVKEERENLERVLDTRFEAVDARFDAVNAKMDARFEGVNARIDSLERQLPTIKEFAEIKARLNQIEKSVR